MRGGESERGPPCGCAAYMWICGIVCVVAGERESEREGKGKGGGGGERKNPSSKPLDKHSTNNKRMIITCQSTPPDPAAGSNALWNASVPPSHPRCSRRTMLLPVRQQLPRTSVAPPTCPRLCPLCTRLVRVLARLVRVNNIRPQLSAHAPARRIRRQERGSMSSLSRR